MQVVLYVILTSLEILIGKNESVLSSIPFKFILEPNADTHRSIGVRESESVEIKPFHFLAIGKPEIHRLALGLITHPSLSFVLSVANNAYILPHGGALRQREIVTARSHDLTPGR